MAKLIATLSTIMMVYNPYYFHNQPYCTSTNNIVMTKPILANPVSFLTINYDDNHIM